MFQKVTYAIVIGPEPKNNLFVGPCVAPLHFPGPKRPETLVSNVPESVRYEKKGEGGTWALADSPLQPACWHKGVSHGHDDPLAMGSLCEKGDQQTLYILVGPG